MQETTSSNALYKVQTICVSRITIFNSLQLFTFRLSLILPFRAWSSFCRRPHPRAQSGFCLVLVCGMHKLLVHTDGPFLAPSPVSNRNCGRGRIGHSSISIRSRVYFWGAQKLPIRPSRLSFACLSSFS